MTAGAAVGAEWEAGKVVETYEQDSSDEEGEDSADVPEIENYLISSELLED